MKDKTPSTEGQTNAADVRGSGDSCPRCKKLFKTVYGSKQSARHLPQGLWGRNDAKLEPYWATLAAVKKAVRARFRPPPVAPSSLHTRLPSRLWLICRGMRLVSPTAVTFPHTAAPMAFRQPCTFPCIAGQLSCTIVNAPTQGVEIMGIPRGAGGAGAAAAAELSSLLHPRRTLPVTQNL